MNNQFTLIYLFWRERCVSLSILNFFRGSNIKTHYKYNSTQKSWKLLKEVKTNYTIHNTHTQHTLLNKSEHSAQKSNNLKAFLTCSISASFTKIDPGRKWATDPGNRFSPIRFTIINMFQLVFYVPWWSANYFPPTFAYLCCYLDS